MRNESVGTLERRRAAKIGKLSAVGPFVAATLNVVRARCGNPNCRCASGERHLAHTLTRKERSKTVSIYVPKHLVREVGKWATEWKRVRRLLAEVSELSERIVRLDARARKAAAQNKSRAVRTRPSPSTPRRSTTSSAAG
jgi:hypothetical protein